MRKIVEFTPRGKSAATDAPTGEVLAFPSKPAEPVKFHLVSVDQDVMTVHLSVPLVLGIAIVETLQSY